MDVNLPYGSFTSETDSDTDSDSDLKPNGYIVLHKICSHCTDSDSDPYSLLLYTTGIQVCIRIRDHLWQCKCVIIPNLKFLPCCFDDSDVQIADEHHLPPDVSTKTIPVSLQFLPCQYRWYNRGFSSLNEIGNNVNIGIRGFTM